MASALEIRTHRILKVFHHYGNIVVTIFRIISTGMFVENLVNFYHSVGFGVLTAVVMKCIIF
jgi:hypothetical protein